MNESSSLANTAQALHHYPDLAKPESDGIYCYHIQRRISCVISGYCHAKGMSPNTATFIDACFAVIAGIALYVQNYMLAVLCIQLFGIWSCVDGELARLSGKSSTLGDFYDTMVDRASELIIVAGILFSFNEIQSTPLWQPLLFAYIGAIFLITVSSEKFRSTYHRNYPKRRVEPLFSWLCAGSDIRFLHLSIAIVWFSATGNPAILFWLIVLMTGALYINFVFRLLKISQLDQSISP
jgi:phosphatidylglycerophosphate synthase